MLWLSSLSEEKGVFPMSSLFFVLSRTLWRGLIGLSIFVLAFSAFAPARASTPIESQPIAVGSQEIGGEDEEGSSYPVYRQTSAFLAGKVAIGVVAIESSTSSIPNQENWTADELKEVHQEIRAGLQKWIDWKPANTPLEFVVDVNKDGYADDPSVSDGITDGNKSNFYAEVPYEPITYASGAYNIWTSAALTALGYTAEPTVELTAYKYAQDLRQRNNADWAFVLFVVDSSNDNDSTPGAFTNGQYMISRTFGPLAVITYNNGLRGTNNLEWTVAQIVGRMFGAGFQYPDLLFDTAGCGSATKKFGYLGTANAYCGVAVPSGEPNPRLMYHGDGAPDSITKLQVGWRDTDSDGLIDLMDTRPSILFSPYPFNPTTDNPLTYVEGGTRRYRAFENPVAPAVCLARPTDECFYSYYFDITPDDLAVTINKIQTVEFRVDGGAWNNATLSGSDPDYKIYTFTTPTLQGGRRKIEVRARNSVGEFSSIASETVIIAVGPANDDFANRISISSLPYNHAVNTSSATPTSDTYSSHSDPIPYSLPSCGTNRRGLHSVWYQYTASTNDRIYADTFGSDYATVLSVWKDTNGNGVISNNELVVCHDASGSVGASQVQFTP
ncbi:MAG: hypothetical protein RMK43_12705, partial [Cyclobacteriaceae bacterium]|nr:hypothetical protein [Cyclobacteriaceae bacterium]